MIKKKYGVTVNTSRILTFCFLQYGNGSREIKFTRRFFTCWSLKKELREGKKKYNLEKRVHSFASGKTKPGTSVHESFIFNFDNLDNLKRIREKEKETREIEQKQDTEIEEKENYTKEEEWIDKEPNKDSLLERENQKKLKKTKKVYSFLIRQLKKYEPIPLNRYFYIFYKNVEYLSLHHLIQIIFLAIQNRRYNYVKQEKRERENEMDISNDSSLITIGLDNKNKEKEEEEEKELCHIDIYKEIKKDLFDPNKGIPKNYIESYYQRCTKIDYVYKLLCLLKNKLLQKKFKDDINIRSLYKLTFSLHYFKMKTDKCISIFATTLLKKEMDLVNKEEKPLEKSEWIKKLQIKNEKDLDLFLYVLLLEQKNLNSFIYNMLYDYLRVIAEKECFSISCKHIAILIQMNQFELHMKNQYFFNLICDPKKDLLYRMTMKDVNYFLFYQLKNNIVLPFFSNLLQFCMKSSVNEELIQNIDQLSLSFLHYEHSKKLRSMYPYFVELTYKLYTFIIKNYEEFINIENKEEEGVPIYFIHSFLLTQCSLRNSTHWKESEKLYLLILHTILFRNEQITHEQMVLWFHFFNFRKDHNQIIPQKKQREGGGNHRFEIEREDKYGSNEIFHYMAFLMKQIYNYKEEKKRDMKLFPLEQKFLENISVKCTNKKMSPYIWTIMGLPCKIITKKYNKNHLFTILNILQVFQYNNMEKEFCSYLLSQFHTHILNYPLDLFDLDKILIAYSHLQWIEKEMVLRIINILEKIQSNVIQYEEYIYKELYFFDCLTNIMLSIQELHMNHVINTCVFKKLVMQYVDRLQINSILVMLQYECTKERGIMDLLKEDIKNIVSLLVAYIKRKYILCDDIKNDLGVPEEKEKYLFTKKEEEDTYEMLLLRIVFVHLCVHSNFFQDHILYNQGKDTYKEKCKELNKILLHLKKNFTDRIHINIETWKKGETKNPGIVQMNESNDSCIIEESEFSLIMNYFLFNFRYDLKYIDKNIMDIIKYQYSHIQKFTNIHYNYKYLYMYRILPFSILNDIYKKQVLEKCKTINNKKIQVKNEEEFVKKEFIQVLFYFHQLYSEKGIRNSNSFINFFKKNNIRLSYQKMHPYQILFNKEVILSIKGDIISITTNVPFFNFILPLVVETKELKLAVEFVFKDESEYSDSYQLLFQMKRKLLRNYNYEIVLLQI